MEAALQQLPGVSGAAAAVRRSAADRLTRTASTGSAKNGTAGFQGCGRLAKGIALWAVPDACFPTMFMGALRA